jgi:hypothetical protein
MDRVQLKAQCESWQRRYYSGQRNWSVAHHFSVFGSIVCSIVAGALIQAEMKIPASTLTATAAALTAIAAAGGFSRKWRSNRMSRSRVDGILLDLEADNSDVVDLSGQLKAVILQHDQEVVTPDDSPPRADNAKE